MAPNTLCDTANSDDAKGNLTLVEKILQTGFRIDWHSEWRQSPLFVAVAKVLEPGVFLLLRYSADANGRLDTLRPKAIKSTEPSTPAADFKAELRQYRCTEEEDQLHRLWI
jgi:hypothetical protein